MAGGWEESAAGLLIWLSRDPDGTAQVGSWISLTEKKQKIRTSSIFQLLYSEYIFIDLYLPDMSAHFSESVFSASKTSKSVFLTLITLFTTPDLLVTTG